LKYKGLLAAVPFVPVPISASEDVESEQTPSAGDGKWGQAPSSFDASFDALRTTEPVPIFLTESRPVTVDSTSESLCLAATAAGAPATPDDPLADILAESAVEIPL